MKHIGQHKRALSKSLKRPTSGGAAVRGRCRKRAELAQDAGPQTGPGKATSEQGKLYTTENTSRRADRGSAVARRLGAPSSALQRLSNLARLAIPGPETALPPLRSASARVLPLLALAALLTLLTLLVLLSPDSAQARHAHPERWYQERWCAQANGQAEVILDDGTRCDCITDEHAIEFDFPAKWAEAIGQSLHYSVKTGKRPGIVLILENPEQEKHFIERLDSTIKAKELGITLWLMRL